MDEYFDVGNEKMEYPGDPNASASNIVRCRCITLYYTAQQAKMFFIPYNTLMIGGK